MRACVLAMVVLLWGCGVSPEDLFEFNGLVTSAGRPLTGQVVEVRRDSSSDLGALGYRWSTLPCPGAKTLATTATDALGRFNVELFRAQVEPPGDQGFVSGSYCLRFTTDAEGTSSWVDVRPGSQQNELGALRLWRPDARLEGAMFDGGALLSFDPPPSAPQSADARVRVSLVAADGVWWDAVIDLTDAGVSRVKTELAPEWVEDRPVSVRLEAGAMGWESDYQQLIMSTSSNPVRFGQLAQTGLALAGAEAPPSRGASCLALGSPCPLTDGSPAPVMLDGGTVVELELVSPMVVRKVWVRGRRYVPLDVGGAGPTPTWWYDGIYLIELETGEGRMLTAIDVDGGTPGPADPGMGPFQVPLFLELDGYFVLDVPEPLPPGRRYELIFGQPLESLAEVSLFDH